MSYSTLKKALRLFEEPVSNKTQIPPSKIGNFNLLFYDFFITSFFLKCIIFAANKSFKSKSHRTKSVFKVPHFTKSDAGKSIQKIKEQIKNEKEFNLVKLNLERLHKLDKTSCVNKITSNLVWIFKMKLVLL